MPAAIARILRAPPADLSGGVLFGPEAARGRRKRACFPVV
jgi:hypothetical protein